MAERVEPVAAALAGGVALLERALGYTLGSLNLVVPETLHLPTPCARWDLGDLLDHMDDSLAALMEGANPGHIPLVPDEPGPGRPKVVASLRSRACTLLGAWAAARRDHGVSIGDCTMSAVVVAGVGAVEVAVHGWDVARTVGRDRPIPPELAGEMLDLVPLFVTDADRPARFAHPTPLPARASPSDRLLSFLGRDLTP